jgi:hypothetical protein
MKGRKAKGEIKVKACVPALLTAGTLHFMWEKIKEFWTKLSPARENEKMLSPTLLLGR